MNSDDVFTRKFAAFIKEEVGIIYEEDNFFQLKKRLLDIAQERGLKSIKELSESTDLAADKEFQDMILDRSTNNETMFFRDRRVFSELIKQLAERHLESSRHRRPFKVWSAACSTGQEVYSLAYTFETLKKTNPTFNFEIVATDYSVSAIEKAKSGRYHQYEVQRGLTSAELVELLDRPESEGTNTPTDWTVKPKFKRNVKFQQINLIKDWSFNQKFDLVLCRNVLIYQNVESKLNILRKIHQVMEPDSAIILGGTENSYGMDGLFKKEIKDRLIYFLRMEKEAKSA